MLSDVPTGTHCLVDANILCYHFIRVPDLSAECTRFIKRIEQQEVTGSTSATVIPEAMHKVMLAEAVQRYGLESKGLAHRLQPHPDLLPNLTEHLQVGILTRVLRLHVEPLTLDILEKAANYSVQHGLLTNDAISMIVMEKLSLTNLVTNDDNFDKLPAITVWKPR